MIRKLLVAAGLIVIGSMMPHASYADSLTIAPVINKDIQLNAGEKKKGFIDISNPTASNAHVTLAVQAFKQTDAEGGLAFYDSEQVREGVLLDLNDFDLGARETIRVYYLLDSSKLPSGTVFAAIFAQNDPAGGAATQSLRVGSLLSITNGASTPKTATIKRVAAPFFQIGDSIRVTADVANESQDTKTTGVFPILSYSFWPYGGAKAEGPLVFKGVTRSIEYRKPGNYVGLIKVDVSAGENEQSTIIFAVTGVWRWLLPILVIIVVIVTAVILKRRRNH